MFERVILKNRLLEILGKRFSEDVRIKPDIGLRTVKYSQLIVSLFDISKLKWPVRCLTLNKKVNPVRILLDNIEDIGPTRRNKLIKKYKTINNIKEAPLEELEKLIGKKGASNIKSALIKEE